MPLVAKLVRRSEMNLPVLHKILSSQAVLDYHLICEEWIGAILPDYYSSAAFGQIAVECAQMLTGSLTDLDVLKRVVDCVQAMMKTETNLQTRFSMLCILKGPVESLTTV